MARGRAPGYEDQRALILEQAAALFAQRGYPATSMNEVAQACGLSKPTLYHYFRDKDALLVNIAEEHVTRLQTVVQAIEDEALAPTPRLRALIQRIVQQYAGAQNAHRVLTEDVRFLNQADQQRVLDKERQVVEAFSRAIDQIRPQLQQAGLSKPLTMLLFGMINWMFTWLKPDGELTHEAVAPIVADLFFGGLPAVQAAPAAKPPARKTPARKTAARKTANPTRKPR